MIVFAIIDPFGIMLFAMGRVVRSLKIAFLVAPVVILGYVLGLGHGSTGVAIGFSSAMVALLVPVIWWARHETPVAGSDVIRAVKQPLISILVAAAVAVLVMPWLANITIPLVRLTASSSVLFGIYGFMLFVPFKQGAVYLEFFRQTGIWRRPTPQAAEEG